MSQPMSIRECISFAREIERAGALFYARMATQFEQYPPLRELFMSLALDERSHEDLFERLVALTPNDDAARSLTAIELKALTLHRFFVSPDAALAALHQVKSVQQALAVALEFEQETLDSFVALRSLLETAMDLDVIDRLIETERVHVERLRAFVR